jgi:hypothetical protein
MKVRESTFAQFRHGQIALRVGRLAKVLQRAQTAQGGIEEGQQMGNQHVFIEQLPIAVRVRRPQPLKVSLQHPQILASHERLGPLRRLHGYDRGVELCLLFHPSTLAPPGSLHKDLCRKLLPTLRLKIPGRYWACPPVAHKQTG